MSRPSGERRDPADVTTLAVIRGLVRMAASQAATRDRAIVRACQAGIPRRLLADAAGVSEATIYRMQRASRAAS